MSAYPVPSKHKFQEPSRAAHTCGFQAYMRVGCPVCDPQSYARAYAKHRRL